MHQEIDAARLRGDLGVESSASRAERTAPGWIENAVEAVRSVVSQRFVIELMDGCFTIEMIREWAEIGGLPKPSDARAWGHVARRAVALGIIERIPNAYAPAASSNGSPKPLYRRGSGGADANTNR